MREQVVRATRATTTHDGTIHAWWEDSFLGSIQTAVRECAVNNKSCAVLRSVLLGVIRSPDHITEDALDVSCSAGNVLTDWNNTSS